LKNINKGEELLRETKLDLKNGNEPSNTTLHWELIDMLLYYCKLGPMDKTFPIKIGGMRIDPPIGSGFNSPEEVNRMIIDWNQRKQDPIKFTKRVTLAQGLRRKSSKIAPYQGRSSS
jgi:hypothetical protein